jgi:hypothetical protein
VHRAYRLEVTEGNKGTQRLVMVCFSQCSGL